MHSLRRRHASDMVALPQYQTMMSGACGLLAYLVFTLALSKGVEARRRVDCTKFVFAPVCRGVAAKRANEVAIPDSQPDAYDQTGPELGDYSLSAPPNDVASYPELSGSDEGMWRSENDGRLLRQLLPALSNVHSVAKKEKAGLIPSPGSYEDDYKQDELTELLRRVLLRRKF